MPMNRVKKTARLIAAAVALLAVSVSAAVVWLTPAQVAEELDNPALAAAFEGKDAIVLNETQTAGDYTVTLGGLVSHTTAADTDTASRATAAAISRAVFFTRFIGMMICSFSDACRTAASF